MPAQFIQTYCQAYERLRGLTGKVAELPRWEELTEDERKSLTHSPNMWTAFDKIVKRYTTPEGLQPRIHCEGQSLGGSL